VTAEPTADRWAEILDELEAGLAEAETALGAGALPPVTGAWIVPVVSGRMPQEHCARAAALLQRQHLVIAALAEASVHLRDEIRLIDALEPTASRSTPLYLDEPA
jgi:hypothetical protein